MTPPDPTTSFATATAALEVMVAHGGRFTWDEALMVGIPIAVFAAILVTANKRAKELQAKRDAELAGDVEDVPDLGGDGQDPP